VVWLPHSSPAGVVQDEFAGYVWLCTTRVRVSINEGLTLA